MAAITKTPVQPNESAAEQIELVVLPDVSTQAHPSARTDEPVGTGALSAGEEQLQKVLPEFTALAQKVGGFKKLAEIANALDEMGK